MKFTDSVQIGNIKISQGHPAFIIAEAGVNHNGDIKLAKKLVDIAKDSGADCVKFQTFKAESVATRTAPKAKYQITNTASGENETQLEMIKKLELKADDFKELFLYAKKREIIFLSSPFDQDSADLLDHLGVNAFKIPSGEITNLPFLKFIAKKRKPLIISTGMSTLQEVEEALRIISQEGLEDIVLLHCTSNYPAQMQEINLRAMQTLRERFMLPVGISDHSLGISVPIAAVALGASCVEKHFTLDKNLLGPDHQASLEPKELKQMVQGVRDIEAALGSRIKSPTSREVERKKISRRSIVARINIAKGTVLTKEMIAAKRPGTGIEPKYIEEIIGKKVLQDIGEDDLLQWSNFG